MNASQGNVIGAGIGPDEKFVLRSRKILAALIMLAPAFGFSPEGIDALQGFGDKLLPAIAAGLVLWSTVRADGARITWKPKLSWIGKLNLARKLSKLAVVAVILAPLAVGCGKHPNAQMTPAQCRKLVAVAKLGIAECNRLDEPEKVEKCIHYTRVALEVAEAACGFVPDREPVPEDAIAVL